MLTISTDEHHPATCSGLGKPKVQCVHHIIFWDVAKLSHHIADLIHRLVVTVSLSGMGKRLDIFQDCPLWSKLADILPDAVPAASSGLGCVTELQVMHVERGH